MIGTLIESRARVEPHSLGSMVSVIVHGTIIAAAVFARAARTTHGARPFEVAVLRIPSPSPRQQESSARESPVHSGVAAVPRVPSISAPMIVPTEIPSIDLTTSTATDFSGHEPRGGEQCVFACMGGTAVADDAPPFWAANEVMMQLRESPLPPRYPDALRRAGVEGTVVVKFVVDTLGRVDMSSIEVLSSSHELFTAAVRESLGRLRFNPAKIGGHKFRAAAILPFQFVVK